MTMTIRPFAPFDAQSIQSADAALNKLLLDIEELEDMSSDQIGIGPKQHWILDNNAQAFKATCDRFEELVQLEKRS